MSNLARAWAERQATGGGCQLHLLEAIAAFLNDDLGFCIASTRYLAARLRKSEATIARALAALEAPPLHLIRRETTRWGPDGGARRRIYLVGYDPVVVERELKERREQARARRAAGHRGTAAAPVQAAPPPEPSEAPGGPAQNESQVLSFCEPGPRISCRSESLAESREDSSEPGGSGPGTPAPSAKARLFSEGRPGLVALGVDRREAGDVIGRWLRDSGDDAERVLGAIRRARDAAPHTPIPWITAALKKGSPEDAPHGSGPSGYRRCGATIWMRAERQSG